MDQMVQENEGLAYKWVRHYLRTCVHLEKEDLMQEARLGLVRAVEKFDPAAGASFGTYATGWIRQRISRAVKQQEFAIHIPMWQLRGPGEFEELPRVIGSLNAPIDPQYCEAEFTYLGVTSRDWAAVTASLDNVEEETLAELDRLALCALVDGLPEPMRTVIIQRFGIDGGGERSLNEVAAVIGKSRQTVHSLQRQALHELRKMVGAEEEG